MNIYEELGATRLINCAGTYTIIGGSKMSEAALQAACEAARDHVEIEPFLQSANRRIAEMTHNEHACITAGGMAAIHLCTAAALSMKYGRMFHQIPLQQVAESEVIMFRAHRNPYDYAIERLGVTLVEVGYPNNNHIATEEDLETAVTDRTAAIFFLASEPGGWLAPGALDLESTLRTAKRLSIPVIIDAAAQLPPKSNLWRFTEMGASAVIFSGGKDLCGPQTTGLVLGRHDLLSWLDRDNFPHYGSGRIHKVGREEIAALYTAVKEYVAHDEEKRIRFCEHLVEELIQTFHDSPVLRFTRVFPNEAGQPVPRARVDIQSTDLSLESLQQKLLECNRSIYTKEYNGHLYINPMTINEEEFSYVLSELKRIAGIS